MSELLSLQPEAPSSILSAPSELNASTIDQNLQSIRAIESTWRLPELPDTVKLDLAASPQLDPQGIGQFLSQLERDLYAGEDDPPAAGPSILPSFRVIPGATPFGPVEQDGFERANAILTSLRGLKQSEALDANAVQRWKMKAIEAGYLEPPPDGIIDGSWSPELSSIQREMQYDQYDKKMRGDRFGAVPLGGAGGFLQTLFDWTSPSGLMRAAVDLDLFWDTGAIGKEFSSWGDKWRKLGDSKDVLDFGKNLFDALTGPIDDLIVPALNMALLFSGVGAGTNFARLGLTGLKGVEAANAFRSATALYKVPLVGRVFPQGVGIAQQASRLGEASWTARRLLQGGETAQALGGKMAAWRNLRGVVATKGIVQTGMKLGLVSQVENRLLPGYQGGKSLGDIQGIAEGADRLLHNPWIATVGETLFAPYTIFEPGTFVRGGSEAVRKSFHFLGTAPGRATAGGIIGAGVGAFGEDTGDVFEGAAIGAGLGAAAPGIGKGLSKVGDWKVPLFSPLIGHTGDFLAKTSYLPMGQDQRITNVMLQAVQRKSTPEQWEAFRKTIDKDGFLRAFADRYNGGDLEAAGGATAYVMLSGAISHTAAAQAGHVGSEGWRQRYWIARNKLQAQLRVFGPDASKEEVVWSILSKETKGRKGLADRFRKYMDEVDDTTLAELIAHHNEQANLTMRQLLSPENLPVDGLDELSSSNLRTVVGQGAQEPSARLEAMVDYVATSLDSFGNWGTYTPLTTDLRGLISGGLFDEVQLRAPKSAFGHRLKMLDYVPEWTEAKAGEELVDWAPHLHDELLIDKKVSAAQWRKNGGAYNPLARELDPSKSRLTLAKKDHFAKQHFIEEAAAIEDVFDMQKAWRTVGTIPAVEGVPHVTQARLGNLTISEMEDYVKALGLTGPAHEKKRRALMRLNRLASHHRLTVDGAFEKTLGDLATGLAADTKWVETYGFEPLVRAVGPDGKKTRILGGFEALKARQASLRKEARFRAAELDVDDLIEKLALSHGFDETVTEAPELLAPMPGQFFHGTSSEVVEFQPYMGRSSENLFGPGVYTTDTPGVAASYTRKGRGKEPNVYRLEWTGTSAPNVIDLTKPQSAMSDALRHQLDQLADAEWADLAIDDVARVRQLLDDPSIPAENLYSEFKELLYGIPRTEVDEILQDVNEFLQAAGVDALTHAGGVRVGGKGKHNVTIWLDPAKVKTVENVTEKTRGRSRTVRKPNYDADEVRRFKDFVQHADQQGYKVVYGADFLAPDDLLHQTGLFADINARHMNALTLGNFFGRKHPEALARKVQQARQISIGRELARARGQANALAPDDPEVAQAISDLYQHLLIPELSKHQDLVDDLAQQALSSRFGSALKSASAPRNIQDLGLGRHMKKVVEKLTSLGWSETDARAIWQGLKAGRYADWNDQGLYALEAKLRGKSQAISALHVLGGSTEARKLWTGAVAGAAIGAATSDDNLEGALLGGAIGAGGKRALGVVTDRAEKALDLSKWARYGYLADNLAAARDKMRFSLSPFFDLSRFTEAHVLNQIATPLTDPTGKRIATPLNASPRGLKRSFRKQFEADGMLPSEAAKAADEKFRTLRNEYRNAAKGHFDPDSIEELSAWFEEIGILGFNPTNWKTATFHRMREAGLHPTEAFEAVEAMYHYGTGPRSAAEQTANFIFFPFSFQKKTLVHAAKWLSDDMSRAVLLHDAYKAYQVLDEEYDLGKWAEDHLPVLEKLQQLNLFAFGISPGRLGGINAPFIDSAIGNPLDRDPDKRGLVFNLFNPIGINIEGPDSVANLKQVFMRTVPAINDLRHMIEDTAEQGHVLFDPSHMTRAAEARNGFDEWTKFKRGVDEALKAQGATLYDLHNNPGLAPLKAMYLGKRVDLENKYGGWVEAKERSIAKQNEMELERQHRVNTVLYRPSEATAVDLAFAEFETQLDTLKQVMAQRGVTDLLDAPPEILDRIRGVAIEMARRIPGFDRLYERFYSRTFGPITSPVA